MPSESQYEQAVLALQGGLNFVDETLGTNRGNLSDCLNVEVSDRLGLTRIHGNEIFDQGPYNSSLIYTNTVMLTISSGTIGNLVAGEALSVDDAAYKKADRVFGYYLGSHSITSGDSLFLVADVVITNYEAFLAMEPGVSTFTGADSSETCTYGTGLAYYLDEGAEAEVAALNTYFYDNNVARTAPNADGTSTNGPISGLHRYKGNGYAITDFLLYDFTTGVEEVFAGDTLTDTATEATFARVIDVDVTSGSWAGGDAAGTILVKSVTAGPTLGAQSVFRVGSYTAALTYTQVSDTAAWGAGMFRSTAAGGWSEVPLGYEFAFAEGSTSGPPPVFDRGEGNAAVVPATAASAPTTASDFAALSWTQNGAGSVLACIEADDANNVTLAVSTPSPPTYIQAKDFTGAVSIPEGSEVTGIQLKISGSALKNAGGDHFPYFLAQPFDNSGQIGTAKSTATLSEASATPVDYILGGPDDTWGIDDLPAALAAGFGFNIAPRRYGSSNTNTFLLNYVELTVYYSSNITTYYFYDPAEADDVLAPITSYYLDEGAWADDDAHGKMQVASITPVGASTRTYIQAGNEIWTGEGGTGSFIARVESNANYAYLPSLSQLQAQESRYQLITANFYGNADWETIYGVSGAGQAFAYDGYYFRRIYTGLAPDLDKPRHIAYHQGALALGYDAGNVTISVPGNPEDYNGVAGAVSIDVGDPVTGLLRMNGTSLGVFCRGSISTIVGTSINNYSHTVVSPAEGAREYTAQLVGEPVYCSNKGITTLTQTAAYGDFLGEPLSAAITPWLLPRLQNTRSPLTKDFNAIDALYSSSVGVAFATVCRTSNQYRLVFDDGSILSMTLQGAQKLPVFTLQRYDKWTVEGDIDDAVKYSAFIPLACSSVVDTDGRERIHMSHYNPIADANNSQTLYYVYEQELSWSFCGHPVPWRFTLNENFFGNPFRKDTVAKVAMHGLSLGYAPAFISMGKEYGVPLATTRASVDISLPRFPTSLTQDLKPVMNIANVSAGEARSFNINLFHPLTGDGVVSPPFSAQMLLVQHKEGRGDN